MTLNRDRFISNVSKEQLLSKHSSAFNVSSLSASTSLDTHVNLNPDCCTNLTSLTSTSTLSSVVNNQSTKSSSETTTGNQFMSNLLTANTRPSPNTNYITHLVPVDFPDFSLFGSANKVLMSKRLKYLNERPLSTDYLI